MLDAIQQRFAGHESGLFDRLTDQVQPLYYFSVYAGPTLVWPVG